MYLWHLQLSLCNIYFRAEEFANSPSILNHSEDSHKSLDFILSSVKHWDQHYFSMLVFVSSWTLKFIFLYRKGTHLCKEYNLTELLKWLKYTFFTKGGKQTQTKPNKWTNKKILNIRKVNTWGIMSTLFIQSVYSKAQEHPGIMVITALMGYFDCLFEKAPCFAINSPKLFKYWLKSLKWMHGNPILYCLHWFLMTHCLQNQKDQV